MNDERRANITDISSKRSAIEEKKVCTSPIWLKLELLTVQFADSMKRFTYLLGQTELFQHFIDLKVCLPASPVCDIF